MSKKRKAQAILNDEKKLANFAALNELSVQAARALLQRLLEKPESSPEFDEYNFSSERSDEYRGYRAGRNDARQDAHEAGFGKGVALGMVAGAAGTALLISKFTK